MIQGRFGENGKLIFTIELITADGEQIAVDTLLDTGFTTGFLAVHIDDIEALGWTILTYEVAMETAQGIQYFGIYSGRVIVDGQEFVIPVHVGEDLPEILFGRQWLSLMKLIVDEKNGVLSLEYVVE